MTKRGNFGSLTLSEVDSPKLFAGFSVEFDEDVAHAADIDGAAIDGRGASYPTAIFGGKEWDFQGAFPIVFPELVAGVDVESLDDFVRFVLSCYGENLIVGRDWARIPLCERGVLEFAEMVIAQGSWPGTFGNNFACPFGTSPLIPVTRLKWSSDKANKES